MQRNRKNDDSGFGVANVPVHRRGFLIWSALTAVGVACTRLWTDSTLVRDVRLDRMREFSKYPVPGYLPPGYDLLMEQDDRPDGFRGITTQTCLVYRGPRAATSIVPSGTRYPLLFFATKGSNSRLAGTEQVEGEGLVLRFSDGTATPATYFDGMWEPIRTYDANGNRIPGNQPAKLQWSRLNLHSMIFQWGEFQIGIRGSRLCGVQFDEMIRVASSIEVPE